MIRGRKEVIASHGLIGTCWRKVLLQAMCIIRVLSTAQTASRRGHFLTGRGGFCTGQRVSWDNFARKYEGSGMLTAEFEGLWLRIFVTLRS